VSTIQRLSYPVGSSPRGGGRDQKDSWAN